MDRIENKFSIKRIHKSNDNDYIQALKIYNEQTPASIKTDTNEITYWITNKRRNSSFELMVFAMYLDDTVIGFAMVTYISKTKSVILEYMSFISQFRVNTTFFTYLNLIQNYLIEIDVNVNYYLVEISNKENGKDIDKESKFFKKLICLEGFRKLDATYYTLQLGMDDFESNFEANLYIKSADSTKTISRETYISIINGIYYDYFVGWYEAFLSKNDISKYKKHVDSQYELIEKSLTKLPIIGASSLNCPIVDNDFDIKTGGQVPSKKQSKQILLIPIVIVIVMILPLIVVLSYTYLMKYFGITMSSVSTLIGATFSAILTTVVALILAKRKS